MSVWRENDCGSVNALHRSRNPLRLTWVGAGIARAKDVAEGREAVGSKEVPDMVLSRVELWQRP